MNLQQEILEFVRLAPISPVDLADIMKGRHPELKSDDIKMAISPLLSIGKLVVRDRKLVVPADKG